MPLGTWKVEPVEEGVLFLPGPAGRRRSAEPITVPYARIARVITNEPQGRSRGAFTLLLDDGGDVTIYFAARHLPRMRAVHRQVWQRVSTRSPG